MMAEGCLDPGLRRDDRKEGMTEKRPPGQTWGLNGTLGVSAQVFNSRFQLAEIVTKSFVKTIGPEPVSERLTPSNRWFIIELIMPETLGYMVTWTTYGTWLQGDRRGYVRNGKILPADRLLYERNVTKLSGGPVSLSLAQRRTVRTAIFTEAERLGQKIFALAIGSNHVHLLVEYIPKAIGRVVSHYKHAARLALADKGNTDRWWTKGYDKRYCFDKCSQRSRIAYVIGHSRNPRINPGAKYGWQDKGPIIGETR